MLVESSSDNRGELSRVVMVEYSCGGRVELSRVVISRVYL